MMRKDFFKREVQTAVAGVVLAVLCAALSLQVDRFAGWVSFATLMAIAALVFVKLQQDADEKANLILTMAFAACTTLCVNPVYKAQSQRAGLSAMLVLALTSSILRELRP